MSFTQIVAGHLNGIVILSTIHVVYFDQGLGAANFKGIWMQTQKKVL